MASELDLSGDLKQSEETAKKTFSENSEWSISKK